MENKVLFLEKRRCRLNPFVLRLTTNILVAQTIKTVQHMTDGTQGKEDLGETKYLLQR